MSGLDFEMVANNTVSLQINILGADKKAIDGTSLGLSVKWQWFIPGRTVTKSSSDSEITITLNPLSFTIPLLPGDTAGAPEGYYPHEAVAINNTGGAITITNNDARLSGGLGFIRAQRTVQ